MKLKVVVIEGVTYAVVSDDKPVFVGDDGKDVAVDVANTTTTITRLNGEAKAHRERADAAELKLKTFEGITDPVAAKTALETVKNIKDGELIAAGKVEEIKLAAKRAAEEQVAAANKTNAEELTRAKEESAKLSGQLHSTMIGGGFSRSKLVTDPKHPLSLIIPADLAEARFGKHFKVEDGKVVGYYDDGKEKIFSRSRPGEVADFDEALEQLVEKYPGKDQIIRGTGNSGTGTRANTNNNGNGGKQMTRAEFSKLNPTQQRNASIGKDAVQIVD